MKRQKGILRRDKVTTENAEMEVIKWKRLWNDEKRKIDRERERERERENNRWYLLRLWAKPLRRAKLPMLLRRTHCHNISTGVVI